MSHVIFNVWQLFCAIACIHEECNLCVEVDRRTSTAVTIEEDALNTALASIRLLAVLVIETEDQPTNVESVQENHEVET